VWEGIIEENNEMCDMKSGTGVWGYVTWKMWQRCGNIW
jgi:hypothetical protein